MMYLGDKFDEPSRKQVFFWVCAACFLSTAYLGWSDYHQQLTQVQQWKDIDITPDTGLLMTLTLRWIFNVLIVVSIVELSLTGLMVTLDLTPASILNQPGHEVPTTGLFLMIGTVFYVTGFAVAKFFLT